MSNNNDKEFRNEICYYSFRLFKEPSFLDGFTSILQFKNLIDRYNTDKTEELADRNSIKSDWKAVGNDIWSAFKEYESGTISSSTK